MREFTKIGLKLLLSGAIIVGAVVPGSLAYAETEAKPGTKAASPTQKASVCISPVELKLSNTMRMLWTEHVNWTWYYIVSAIGESPGQKQVLERLLRNQQDLGDALKPYYGKEAGQKFTDLLTEHIVIAGKIIDAVKAGNQQEADQLNKDWYRNGTDIVTFLTTLNPNWSAKELQSMWNRHLQLVTDAVIGVLKNDWAAYIRTSDLGEAHMLMFADVMTRGIVQQFPKQFGQPVKGSR